MDVVASVTRTESLNEVEIQQEREDWINHVMRKFYYCCINASDAASLTGIAEDDIWKRYIEWRSEEGKCFNSELEERIFWAFRRHGSDKQQLAAELGISVNDVECLVESFPMARAARILGDLEKQSRDRFCKYLDSW